MFLIRRLLYRLLYTVWKVDTTEFLSLNNNLIDQMDSWVESYFLTPLWHYYLVTGAYPEFSQGGVQNTALLYRATKKYIKLPCNTIVQGPINITLNEAPNR